MGSRDSWSSWGKQYRSAGIDEPRVFHVRVRDLVAFLFLMAAIAVLLFLVFAAQ